MLKKIFNKATVGNLGERESDGDGSIPPYYYKKIGDSLTVEMRDILLWYSKIPERQLEEHLYSVRDKAWEESPYPCVGQWSFLRVRLRHHSVYRSILERAKVAPQGTFLICDVGAGMGQELRCLAADGVSPANLCAIDVNNALWETGFALFRDRDRMAEARLGIGDMRDLDSGQLSEWKGTLDVMIAGLMLHCFDWEGQLKVATNLVSLAKKQSGSLIIGWQLGGAATHISSARGHTTMFLHSQESFVNLWNQVSQRTGETWHATAKAIQMPSSYLEKQKWLPPTTTMLSFAVVKE